MLSDTIRMDIYVDMADNMKLHSTKQLMETKHRQTPSQWLPNTGPGKKNRIS